MTKDTAKRDKIASSDYETKPLRLGMRAVDRLFKTNLWPTIIVLLVTIVSSSVINQATRQSKWSFSLSLLLEIGSIGISAFCGLLGLAVAIPAQQGKKISIADTINWSLEHYLIYIGILISVLAVALLGLIAFIVPGIILAIWYGLAPVIRLAEGGTVRESFQRSKYLIQGRVVEYLAVLVAGFMFSILGILGPAVQSSVLIEWYTQIKEAKDKDQALPPISAQSRWLVFGAICFIIFVTVALFSLVTI